MTDYASLKVEELKKLLSDRSLPLSGKKADLVARLQENDEAAKPETKGNEDEIDWDDEQPAAAEPAANASVAPASEAVAETAPAAALATDPVTVDKPAETVTKAPVTDNKTVPASNIDLDEELRRREARAMRFGTTTAAADPAKATEGEDDNAKKAARAARFGINPAAAAKDETNEVKKAIMSSLDVALPDRPLKRGHGGDGAGGRRDSKRSASNRRQGGNRINKQNNNSQNSQNNQNSRTNRNDRRGNGNKSGGGGGGGGDGGGSQRGNKALNFLSDPAERKKAEERAKRFAL
ncbi:hypothetical protein SEPCBS57363_006240 [Sporothrix epigloea]|uniref:SAP domain-containing protein n=1 Tax=Sporothrix epigloea TaxID=1892477 RepID=A0ABP0E4L6_9PEZI